MPRCPLCHHPIPRALTDDEIRSARGRLSVALRKHKTPGPGRPRTKPRCACGAMTQDRAAKRGHKCVATKQREQVVLSHKAADAARKKENG